MIYLKLTNGQHVVILEPTNIEAIKKKPAITPNKEVMIWYTPDVVWLGEQIAANLDTMTGKKLDELIIASHSREEVRNIPQHPMLNMIPDKNTGRA